MGFALMQVKRYAEEKRRCLLFNLHVRRFLLIAPLFLFLIWFYPKFSQDESNISGNCILICIILNN